MDFNLRKKIARDAEIEGRTGTSQAQRARQGTRTSSQGLAPPTSLRDEVNMMPTYPHAHCRYVLSEGAVAGKARKTNCACRLRVLWGLIRNGYCVHRPLGKILEAIIVQPDPPEWELLL